MRFLIRFTSLYLQTFYKDCHYVVGVMSDGHRRINCFGGTKSSMLATQLIFIRDGLQELSEKQRVTGIECCIDFLQKELKEQENGKD